MELQQDKNKKIIMLLLLGLGLVAGLLVLKYSLDSRSRAELLACVGQTSVTCKVSPNGDTNLNDFTYDVQVIDKSTGLNVVPDGGSLSDSEGSNNPDGSKSFALTFNAGAGEYVCHVIAKPKQGAFCEGVDPVKESGMKVCKPLDSGADQPTPTVPSSAGGGGTGGNGDSGTCPYCFCIDENNTIDVIANANKPIQFRYNPNEVAPSVACYSDSECRVKIIREDGKTEEFLCKDKPIIVGEAGTTSACITYEIQKKFLAKDGSLIRQCISKIDGQGCEQNLCCPSSESVCRDQRVIDANSGTCPESCRIESIQPANASLCGSRCSSGDITSLVPGEDAVFQLDKNTTYTRRLLKLGKFDRDSSSNVSLVTDEQRVTKKYENGGLYEVTLQCSNGLNDPNPIFCKRMVPVTCNDCDAPTPTGPTPTNTTTSETPTPTPGKCELPVPTLTLKCKNCTSPTPKQPCDPVTGIGCNDPTNPPTN